MNSGQTLELEKRSREAFSDRLDSQRRTADKAVVWLHAQADRLEWAPSEFGSDEPVDTNDASEIRREWLRLLRRWMDNNPEQMLAIKAGGGALALFLLVTVIFVRAMS